MNPLFADVPLRGEAVRLGCTCLWWGDNSIILFNGTCPIKDRHYNPDNPEAHWARAMKGATDALRSA